MIYFVVCIIQETLEVTKTESTKRETPEIEEASPEYTPSDSGNDENNNDDDLDMEQDCSDASYDESDASESAESASTGTKKSKKSMYIFVYYIQ